MSFLVCHCIRHVVYRSSCWKINAYQNTWICLFVGYNIELEPLKNLCIPHKSYFYPCSLQKIKLLDSRSPNSFFFALAMSRSPFNIFQLILIVNFLSLKYLDNQLFKILPFQTRLTGFG
jgi:hypothetical protein